MSPAPALAALPAIALLAACDQREETYATAADAEALVEQGWLPPLPTSARDIRVAWDLDLSTSHFCADAPWGEIRAAWPALEDAPAPQATDAPDWWREEAASGTEAIRINHGAVGWTLVRTAPAALCGVAAMREGQG